MNDVGSMFQRRADGDVLGQERAVVDQGEQVIIFFTNVIFAAVYPPTFEERITVVHRFVVGGEVVAECCQLLAELGSRGLRHSAAFALKERQGLKGVPGDRGATSSENWASRLGPQGNERGAVEGRQPHVASNTPQGFLSSLGGLLRNTMMYQLHDTAAESTHRAFARDTPSCSREQTNVM